jgi:hypothetical protein
MIKMRSSKKEKIVYTTIFIVFNVIAIYFFIRYGWLDFDAIGNETNIFKN